MTLGSQEFLRRFLLHVLPRGFVRIRSFAMMICDTGKATRSAPALPTKARVMKADEISYSAPLNSKRQSKDTIDKRLACALREASISPTVKNPLYSFSAVSPVRLSICVGLQQFVGPALEDSRFIGRAQAVACQLDQLPTL